MKTLFDFWEKCRLTEGYRNYITTQQKQQVVDMIWDMLQNAYSKIGGFKSSPDKNHLIADSFIWKTATVAGKDRPVAITIAKKTQFGRKHIGAATDGSIMGKKKLAEMLAHDLMHGNSYSEVSGAMQGFMFSRIPQIKNYMIPNRYAAKITGKPIISLDPDGYHYTRLIMGHPHKKLLIGSVNLPDSDMIDDSFEKGTPSGKQSV